MSEKTIAVSGNTGLAPLIGSKLVSDRALDGSVWREKGFSDPKSDTKPDANCIRTEADWAPLGAKRHLQPPQLSEP